MKKSFLTTLSVLLYLTSSYAFSQEVGKKMTREEINQQLESIRTNIDEELLKEFQALTGKPYSEVKEYVKNGTAWIKKDLNSQRFAWYDFWFPAPLRYNIPKEHKNFLNENLKECGVNPDMIDLNYIKQTPSVESPFIATAAGRRSFNRKHIFEQINLYNKFFELPADEQSFVIAHEVNHLLLGHSSIIIDVHNKNPNFPSLSSIIERQADTHAALQNSKIAYGAVKMCRHPYIIDKEAHCKEMQKIYFLMKLKEESSF